MATTLRSRAALAGLAVAVALAGLIPASSPMPAQATEGDGEVRALWVDAFHGGFKSPSQVEKLVADARRGNINTLLIQIRRRGDTYYLGGVEPPALDQPTGFDSLRAVLDAAHGGTPRLEVQAWVPAYPVWSSNTSSPTDPNHPFNRHGPTAPGEDNWLMQREDGETWTGEGYWLDPGHPAVSAYVVDLVTDIARRYDVDGIHLDRLRYFEGDSSASGGRDRRWGYNPLSVTRFGLAYGRAGQPDPNDPLWVQFRRDQVSNLLRRARESVLAVRPSAKISAAVIPWGNGPRTDADWLKTAAYAYVFQDWRAWLEQGLLDQAYPMNYAREGSDAQIAMFDSWIEWERSHSYGRQVIAGLGIYLNTPTDTVRQVRRALAPGPDGSRLAGVSLYSYAVPDASRANADVADDSSEGAVWSALTQPVAENSYAPPFAAPKFVPALASRN